MNPTGMSLGTWSYSNAGIRLRIVIMALLFVATVFFYGRPTTSDMQQIGAMVVAAFCIVALLFDLPKAFRKTAFIELYTDGFKIREAGADETAYRWQNVTNAGYPSTQLPTNIGGRSRYYYDRNTRDLADTISFLRIGGMLLNMLFKRSQVGSQLTLDMQDGNRYVIDARYGNVKDLIAQLNAALVDFWTDQMAAQIKQRQPIPVGDNTISADGLYDQEAHARWDQVGKSALMKTLSTVAVDSKDDAGKTHTFRFEGVGVKGEAIVKLIDQLRVPGAIGA